jgi:hypothetical protein
MKYYVRMSISLTMEQREILRAECRRRSVGIGALLRETALEAIGRADLSVVDEVEARDPGKHLEQTAVQPSTRYGVRASVMLTEVQRDALEAAAAKVGQAVSALVRNAGLIAAGAPPATLGFEGAPRRGRPLGVPNSPRKRAPEPEPDPE